MVEPGLNCFAEKSYFQIPANGSPNLKKNHFIFPKSLYFFFLFTWKVYKIIFGKPVDNELVYEFNFTELNPKKNADIDLLYYVNKESLG